MHISELSVKRPITTSMFFVAVLMIGVISLSRLAVDLLPDLSYPQLTIWTRYQDVAPEEVESFITRPIENTLATIPGIKKINSVSQEGVSLVMINFEWGTNMDYTTLMVREKLDKVRFDRFPDGASRPVIIRVDPSQQPIMSLSVSGEDLMQLKESAQAIIKRRLEQIDGVALATVTGGLDREIHVDVDVERAMTLGISLNSITSSLSSANTQGSGGHIRKGEFRYSLRTLGEFTDVSELKEVVVGRYDGHAVYLRDIAFVRDSFKERDNVTRYNGDESIGIIVQKEAGSNTVKVSESVKEVLGQLNEEFPDFQVAIAYDQADFISNSINSVLQAIIFGGILAFLVLFLFLHDMRNPLIIAVAIPLSIVATFSLLYFNNTGLNIMSLGGLALGVGMLVDNSIVVLENISRHRQEGKSLIEATVHGAKEVSMPVSASTFTTIAVFFPIIFVEGVAGQLFRDQALTITFSLICSLIVSLTLLPMLATHFMRFRKKEAEPITPLKRLETVGEVVRKEPGLFKKILRILLFPFKLLFIDLIYRYLIYWFLWKIVIYYILWVFLFRMILRSIYFTILNLLRYWFSGLGKGLNIIFTPVFKQFDKQFEKFAEFYERILGKALDNRLQTLLITLSIALIAVYLGNTLDRELMPRVDQGQFEVEVFLPVGSTLEQTDRTALEITNWLLDHDDVESIFSSVGIVQEKGMQSVRATSLNRGLVIVKLKENSVSSTEDVVQYIRDREHMLPVTKINFTMGETTLQQVLGTGESDIVINVEGEDFDESRQISDEVIARLRNIEGLEDVRSNFEEGKPEVRIKVNRDRADRYGATVTQIASYISNSMKGHVATQFKEFDRKIDIVVRPEMKYRDELTDLLDSYFKIGENFIPIRELIDYEYSQGPNEIRRVEQRRVIQVFANIHERDYKDVMSDIFNAVSEVKLPGSDYSVDIAGENEEMRKSFSSLLLALVVSIALVYMILAAQFESLVQPFVIMFAVPLALIGIVFALSMTGNSINIMSAIGTIMLVGIVVNDAIIKVDFINQAHRGGLPLRKAIEEAGKKRLRPILMTTITTVLGLTPMAFGLTIALGFGKGANMQAPLAIAVIGGLLSATFLTLIVIPVIYSYIGGMKETA
ncbi:efflux RND transporter permease subunit [candidate division KSB1 bacterium]